jgi:hypothetical protein
MRLFEEFKLYENMWETTNDQKAGVLKEAASSMYIVAADGEAGGNIYYIGRSKAAAQKEFNAIAVDWLEFGLGGGDTAICLYEYFGPTQVFKDTLATWKAGSDTSYSVNIEELGFALEDCKVLAGGDPDPVEVECWNCKSPVEVLEGVTEAKCPHCNKFMYINW